MIIQDKQDSIEKIGGGESHKFTINVSRKAFQILSDLYSDKPLAIVRELGCNAVDSHVMAGKASLPISIHLPNAMEPYLEIRDFGTGISPENVFQIYSSYFTSTKTASNDAIGCLGLGSKSPFAYTDSFSVTSRYNGVKSNYLAYFDAGGAPTITEAGSEPDTEGNGVSIQIPVKAEDFNKFLEAAKTAFRWFDVKPIVTGQTIDWAAFSRKVVLEGDDWKVVATQYDNGNHAGTGSYAIMGGVSYKIDEYKVNDDLRNVLKGTIIKFPIGELDFTPSRESLSYDERTVANLNARISKVKGEIQALAVAEMAKAQFLDGAAKIYYSLPDFVRGAMGKFVFKGVAMDQVRVGYRQLSKRSYCKNIKTSIREVLHAQDLARLEGISIVLEKPSALWKAREYMDVAQKGDIMVFSADEAKILTDAGIDPAVLVNTSTFAYTKATGTSQRLIDKEVVGQLGGSGKRFGSVNLRTAITDGAKYYAMKVMDNNSYARVKNSDMSKSTLERFVSDPSIVVFVAPRKVKLAEAAGLIQFDAWVDEQIKTLDTPDGQRFLSVLDGVTSISDGKTFAAYMTIAEKGQSNVAKHLLLSRDKNKLVNKFSGIQFLAGLLKVKPAAAQKLTIPPLNALEKHIINSISLDNGYYYGRNDWNVQAYEDYENLFSMLATATAPTVALVANP